MIVSFKRANGTTVRFNASKTRSAPCPGCNNTGAATVGWDAQGREQERPCPYECGAQF